MIHVHSPSIASHKAEVGSKGHFLGVAEGDNGTGWGGAGCIYGDVDVEYT